MQPVDPITLTWSAKKKRVKVEVQHNTWAVCRGLMWGGLQNYLWVESSPLSHKGWLITLLENNTSSRSNNIHLKVAMC